jgi:Zeta toxin
MNRQRSSVKMHLIRSRSTDFSYFRSLFIVQCVVVAAPVLMTVLSYDPVVSWSSYILSSVVRISMDVKKPTIAHQQIVFDLNQSTEEIHRSNDGIIHGKYKTYRSRLDYSFHSVYSEERVIFQDSLVDSLLGGANASILRCLREACCHNRRPWVVFTAGAMGAGKSHTIRLLNRRGLFPTNSFITIDPDQIRQKFPEFEWFLRHNPENAGYLTKKESGLITEVAIDAGLDRGRNVLVDGSLRDAAWHQTFFRHLRQLYPTVRIAILHIRAPEISIRRHVEVSVSQQG